MATLVTLTTLKQHLRKLDTNEDTILAAHLAAAIAYIEDYTGHVVSQREVTDVFTDWGDVIRLRHQPITVGDPTPAMTVEYVDTEGDTVEYEGYVFRNATYPGTIEPPYGDEFPDLGANGTISVTYTAGYDAGEVPTALNQAILLLCGQWFSNRNATSADEMFELPFAVTALCRPYRGAVLA